MVYMYAKMCNEGLEKVFFVFGREGRRKMHAIKVNEKYKFNSLPRSRLINIYNENTSRYTRNPFIL